MRSGPHSSQLAPARREAPPPVVLLRLMRLCRPCRTGPSRSKHEEGDGGDGASADARRAGLEEEGDDDFLASVALPPQAAGYNVQYLQELDQAAGFAIPQAAQRTNLDLSVLTQVLCSIDQAAEADEEWDPDALLQKIAIDLFAETAALGGEPLEEPTVM